MRAKTEIRLTPGQRLSRGLRYSAVGPVDVTRGALGLGVDGAQHSAAWIGDLYRRGRLKDQLRQELAAAQDTIASELAAAQEVVANLPEALQKARGRRRRRPLLLAVLGVGVLAGGAVAFSILRRPPTEEPPTLQPSVPVTPRP
ncbi:cell wall synthesis protein CwsA [Mycolicibacterium gadium]|jgi:hypothetical protein|uniref:Cell wall synthesis protein CwsA n=1 Tax=Mycolicibacterium gadium TaxID=1794 RepID=A0A7I7WT38_MYCGU|nr:cell wall synthesis protein CwsA [Mycolicibacterium gadium]BBZ19897.1 cell wall synthesis protein CwsA [Mycolicibacterium gadium]